MTRDELVEEYGADLLFCLKTFLTPLLSVLPKVVK